MTGMAKELWALPKPTRETLPLDPFQSNSPTPQSLRDSLAGRHPQNMVLGRTRGSWSKLPINSLMLHHFAIASFRPLTVDRYHKYSSPF
uniref:ORF88 n=1 Tax=Bacillus thuringiensis serovar kurstaki str. YBT-1520 TaxID=570416 RepID=B8PS76_BACTK|nr:ORF88 [Bacillus thuringiensis serovar kurstaki str. YBT-1520]